VYCKNVQPAYSSCSGIAPLFDLSFCLLVCHFHSAKYIGGVFAAAMLVGKVPSPSKRPSEEDVPISRNVCVSTLDIELTSDFAL